jgi:ribosomal protein L34E
MDERPHPSPFIAAVARQQALEVVAEHERRYHPERCPHCGKPLEGRLRPEEGPGRCA